MRFGRYDLWPGGHDDGSINTRPSVSLVIYVSVQCSALLYAPTHIHAAKNAHMNGKARAHYLDRKAPKRARMKIQPWRLKNCKIDGELEN